MTISLLFTNDIISRFLLDCWLKIISFEKFRNQYNEISTSGFGIIYVGRYVLNLGTHSYLQSLI